jgi:HAD superfamily hydrolase (TIGR01450 family)
VAPLLDGYDALIVDADGVIYRGSVAVPFAVDALRASPVPWCLLTNNAALPPAAIAERIARLGLAIDPSNVVTSPQGAVAYLQEYGVPAGSPVLIVGGVGIDEAVSAAGYTPVRDRSVTPVAVVQGFGPEVGWRELSEAGYAITAGAVWVATNLDLSIPTEHGLAPGNGALVSAIQLAIGRAPDAVTGKPEPLLFTLAAERLGSSRPLVVGDRIDTDIQGANRAGMDSLLVLTGVAGAQELVDLIDADPLERPTYIAEDLQALSGPVDAVRVAPDAPGSGPLAEVLRGLGRAWSKSDASGNVSDQVRQAIDAWARR